MIIYFFLHVSLVMKLFILIILNFYFYLKNIFEEINDNAYPDVFQGFLNHFTLQSTYFNRIHPSMMSYNNIKKVGQNILDAL